MCGISGYVNYNNDLQDSFSILKDMCQTLEKRGPDEEGFFLSKHSALRTQKTFCYRH